MRYDEPDPVAESSCIIGPLTASRNGNRQRPMKIELDRTGLNRIRNYAPGQITVNESVLRSSVLVTPERLYPDWQVASAEALTREHFQRIAALRPEVVVLGTGARQRFPSPAALQPLVDAGIGLEVMNTPAACRTYNVLAGDGRRVLAALLMIEPAPQPDSTE